MRAPAALASALVLSSTCLAWPFDWDTVKAIKREIEPLLKPRATSYNLSFTPTSGTQGDTAATATSDSNSDADATTTTGDDSSATGTQTSGQTATTGTSQTQATITAAPSRTTGKSSSNSTVTTEYDPRLPAGGISMITPNPYTTEYYKIEDYITWAWNYTSVSSLPSAIDILAIGNLNAATYTLALNESVPGPTQSFTLDTGALQANATVKLLTQTYTLVIHDAAKDVSATPSPGYLGTVKQFTFGMYVPQQYVSVEDGWQCVTCNGAMAQAGRQTLVAIFGMVGITVLSFSWFAGVAGLW